MPAPLRRGCPNTTPRWRSNSPHGPLRTLPPEHRNGKCQRRGDAMSEYHSIMKLRPYQVRALNQIIAKLNSPEAAALLVGPTGCGKTEIIAGLIDRMPRRARTIILQDLVDLVRQNGVRIANYLRDRKVVTMAASLPRKFHLM